MTFRLADVFPVGLIDGDPELRFSRVAVGVEQAGCDSLFLLIEQEYLSNWLHLANAIARGVPAVVGPGPRPELLQPHCEITWVSVDDSADALLQLGLFMRDASAAKRIAVTGSNGKTSTKDMIAHLLRLSYKRTLKSVRNYNGELGVPLTLRKLRPDDQFLVAEVGMGDPGSVRRRAAWVKPHVAVITNVGDSHLSRFGSRQAIAHEKGEVLQALLPDGLAVLNGDDDQCRRLSQGITQRTVFFGLRSDCDFWASDILQDADGLVFQLHHAARQHNVRLPVFGRYQVLNALAAFAVADWAGIELRAAAERMVSFQTAEQRGKVSRHSHAMIIDDAYNSNPWSVQQAAAALAELPVAARYLVLGDMQPLGQERAALVHAELGRFLSTLPLTGICLIGAEIAQLTADYHGSATICQFVDESALVEYLVDCGSHDSAILLKGQDDRLFSRIARALSSRLDE